MILPYRPLSSGDGDSGSDGDGDSDDDVGGDDAADAAILH